MKRGCCVPSDTSTIRKGCAYWLQSLHASQPTNTTNTTCTTSSTSSSRVPHHTHPWQCSNIADPFQQLTILNHEDSDSTVAASLSFHTNLLYKKDSSNVLLCLCLFIILVLVFFHSSIRSIWNIPSIIQCSTSIRTTWDIGSCCDFIVSTNRCPQFTFISSSWYHVIIININIINIIINNNNQQTNHVVFTRSLSNSQHCK